MATADLAEPKTAVALPLRLPNRLLPGSFKVRFLQASWHRNSEVEKRNVRQIQDPPQRRQAAKLCAPASAHARHRWLLWLHPLHHRRTSRFSQCQQYRYNRCLPLMPMSGPRRSQLEEARAKGIEGNVILRVSVTESGKVHDVKVIKGLGYGLDERRWQRSARVRAASLVRDRQRWKPVDYTHPLRTPSRRTAALDVCFSPCAIQPFRFIVLGSLLLTVSPTLAKSPSVEPETSIDRAYSAMEGHARKLGMNWECQPSVATSHLAGCAPHLKAERLPRFPKATVTGIFAYQMGEGGFLVKVKKRTRARAPFFVGTQGRTGAEERDLWCAGRRRFRVGLRCDLGTPPCGGVWGNTAGNDRGATAGGESINITKLTKKGLSASDPEISRAVLGGRVKGLSAGAAIGSLTITRK